MAAEIEETLKRIQTSDGVVGFVIVNSSGIPIKSSFDDQISIHYAGLVQQLITVCKAKIKNDDPSDDLTYLRLRTKHNEIIVILNEHYIMVIIQKPTGSGSPL